jgi:hypothetical protein
MLTENVITAFLWFVTFKAGVYRIGNNPFLTVSLESLKTPSACPGEFR